MDIDIDEEQYKAKKEIQNKINQLQKDILSSK